MMTKNFTHISTAEAWLISNGFTCYLGCWTYQKEDGSATATMCDVDYGRVSIVIHDEEI